MAGRAPNQHAVFNGKLYSIGGPDLDRVIKMVQSGADDEKVTLALSFGGTEIELPKDRIDLNKVRQTAREAKNATGK